MGLPSVKIAQRIISSREFAEWKAFDRIRPIAGERQDWNAALIASTIANVFSKGQYRPNDFLLSFGTRPKVPAEEIEKKMRAIFKGKIKEGKEHGGDDRKTGCHTNGQDK